LPRVNQVTLDLTALLYTLGAALLTALIFGFAPAWKLIRVQPVQALRDSADQTTARSGRVSKSLVIFQIAAAMVVLVATGLLLRSFERLLQTDLGFRPDELLTVRLELPRGKYGGEGRRAQFAQTLLEKLAVVPGVEGAGITSQLPFQGWPQLIMRVQDQALETLPQAEVFVPLAQQNEILGTAISVAIRTRPGGPDLVPALRQAVWSLDPDQPLHNLKPMRQVLVEATAQRRFTLLLLGTFAGFALLLTVVGLYGVLAYAVSRRRREIGIRMALGAQRGNVMQLILRDGLQLALAGIGLGLLGAFGVVRIMRNLLYEVAPTDPLTFATITLLLAGVALLACWLPARRASHVDPIVALRTD